MSIAFCPHCGLACERDLLPPPNQPVKGVLPDRFVCVSCGFVSWGPEPTEEAS